MGKKRRGLPHGMTYAQKLAQEKRIQKAVEEAAVNETVRVRADIQSQQMLWLCVVSILLSIPGIPCRYRHVVLHVEIWNVRTSNSLHKTAEDGGVRDGRVYKGCC